MQSTRFADELRGRRVLVIGLGKSGVACARKCADLGASVIAVDEGAPKDMGAIEYELAGAGVDVRFRWTDPIAADAADLVLPSPGVSVHTPLVARALARGTESLSEIEFATLLYPWPDMIAVTGTNGKTTVTTLIAAMIEAGGGEAVVGGNIGMPLVEVLASVAVRSPEMGSSATNGSPAQTQTWVVVEVSSFQLALAPTFSPRVGVFLNFDVDHLDWHRTTEEYFDAKARLIRNLPDSGLAVLQWADPRIRALADATRAHVVFFSAGEAEARLEVESLRRGSSYLALEGHAMNGVFGESQVQLELKDYRLRGRHNLENAAAATAAATWAGVSVDAAAAALSRFEGLGHRIKHVATIDGVAYYDDSKATNPHAARAAIDSFSEPVVVLMGGRNKGTDLSSLADFAAAKCKAVVGFGEAGEELSDHLPREGRVYEKDLREAVAAASKLAQPGDVVLLSPGCASFDAFSSYAERGDAFEAAVRKLAASGVAPPPPPGVSPAAGGTGE